MFSDILVCLFYLPQVWASTETVSNEEAKKKARLARFAAISVVDNVEGDQRKARALR